MPTENRTALLVSMHGEVCKRATAARILSRDPKTIDAMLADGRLRWACAGTMVDVRSIAAYIQQRPQIDYNTRLKRRRERDGKYCRFSV